MGVYVFRSVHAPYIKVGHYSGKNAYSRVAHRGFTSCLCPTEVRGRVAMDDLELVAWFPGQTKKTESQVKKRWGGCRIYGKSEWLPAGVVDEVVGYLRSLEPDMAHKCDPVAAVLTRKRL